MITGEHTYIRGTEQDDVEALSALYRPGVLRAGLLDGRREPILPSREELQELIGRKEFAEGSFYTVEDREGEIRGFCSLRGVNPEARFCEFSLLFIDTATYATPIADEVTEIMLERAFVRLGLRKVVAYGLQGETELATLLKKHHFESAGRQRQMLYARGEWHDLETFSRANSAPATSTQSSTESNAL